MKLKAMTTMEFTATAPAPSVVMLRPRSGAGQWIMEEKYDLTPFVPVTEYVDQFGNLCQRLTFPKGDFRIQTTAVIETADTMDVAPGLAPTPIEYLPDSVLQFLLPSRFVESDVLLELAEKVTAGQKPGYDQVEAIRHWIHTTFKYQYGTTDGTTSARQMVEQKIGVCKDFAHTGMALCRALRIPARQVVGYLYKLDPMDQHAWFEAYIGGRWYTFDATQAEPRGGRIAIAYGRDAADVALVSEFGPLDTKSIQVSVIHV